MGNPFISFSDHLVSVVEQTGRSVVAVHARGRFNSSGVHWTPGVVITASHTVRQDEDIRIATPDGATVSAELAGRDPGTDLAALRVPGLEIPAIVQASDVETKPGTIVLSVGRFKDSSSTALGLLSSVSGPSDTWRGGKLDHVLRLDLSLPPGGAGSAVVESSGKLVGIATPALSRFSVFAIPVSTVARVTEKLLKHGRMPRGYLGVGLQPVAIIEQLRSKLDLKATTGVIAINVDADGPAGKAGMTMGDVLLELGGRATPSPEAVHAVLDADSIGKKLTARILRGGNAVDLEITIGERPVR